MDYMEIPKLRLQRAREHIQQFAFEAGEFLKTNPYRIVKERYTENAQEYLSLRFRVSQQPPKRLGIIAGDIIHNLRAILDNTICALGEAGAWPARAFVKKFRSEFEAKIQKAKAARQHSHSQHAAAS